MNQYQNYQYQPYPVHPDYHHYYHTYYEIPHTHLPEYQPTTDNIDSSPESDMNKSKNGDFIPTQYWHLYV